MGLGAVKAACRSVLDALGITSGGVYSGGITAWAPVTMTGSWEANTTYSAVSRLVGKSREFRVVISLTGAPTAANLELYYPEGTTADVGGLGDGGASAQSSGVVVDASPAVIYGPLTVSVLTTGVLVRAPSLASHGVITLVTQAAPITFASGDLIYVEFSVPVE